MMASALTPGYGQRVLKLCRSADRRGAASGSLSPKPMRKLPLPRIACLADPDMQRSSARNERLKQQAATCCLLPILSS